MQFPLIGRLAAACAALLAAQAAQAGDFFPTSNQGALQRSFALPALGEARILESGEEAWYGAVDLTTEYHLGRSAREEILQDGETSRFSLSYRGGLGADWEWGVQLPLLVQGGGFLDSFIERWHGFFGLPNGGREFAPRNRYKYRYVRDGVTVLNVQDSSTGLGDVQLSTGWQWRDSAALRGMLKLPSGDENHLAGGNLGGALWLDTALPFARASAWSGYVSAGASLNDQAGVLASLQNRAAAFAGAGLSYRVLSRLQVTSQFYAHTPLYRDTDLEALKKPGLQFVLGGSYRISETLNFLLAFQEDLVTASSPDFSLHFGLSVR